MSRSHRLTTCLLAPVCLAAVLSAPHAFGQDLIGAFAFGSRDLQCETPNQPGTNYTMVLHNSPASVEYDPGRGFGYEVVYPGVSPYGDRAGYGKFGPFDDSPNNRGLFGDDCPEQVYDSFIGAKDFLTPCSAATEGDPNTPCSDDVEGIIFRVDVPNGQYQFVAVSGDADNHHAHRILAENGGAGPPENVGSHVVLVANFDQAQGGGIVDPGDPGEGVFASVGFADKAPPPGQDVVLVDQGPSPVLNVTEGYVRIHQLQGNSNDGPGGTRDPNGGDMVLLELWRVGDVSAAVPGLSFGGGAVLVSLIVGLGAVLLLRRRPAAAAS